MIKLLGFMLLGYIISNGTNSFCKPKGIEKGEFSNMQMLLIWLIQLIFNIIFVFITVYLIKYLFMI